MQDAERDFARVYAGLLARLDPEPDRSALALRAIRRRLSEAEDRPEDPPRGSSILKTPVV